MTVTPKAGVAGPSVRPFELRVRAGRGPENEAVARGTILATRWTTRLWSWTTDPRKDPAAFAALLATPPLDTIESDALDFAWPGAPTPKVPADHFATVAETTLDLPAGRWAFHVTSDDGVRLLVDGKVVHEDWTWHAPKEATVEVSLSEGRHAVRVEHFELDGYATLRCSRGAGRARSSGARRATTGAPTAPTRPSSTGASTSPATRTNSCALRSASAVGRPGLPSFGFHSS